MMFPKEAKDGRTRYNFIRDIQVNRQLMEIVNSWGDDDDFLIISDEDVPPIDSKLISEDLFLAQHPGHVLVGITIPTDAKKYPYVLLPSITEEINVECLSETDHLSLAYYNVGGDDDRLFLSIEDSVARCSLMTKTGGITGFL
nr:hypothetical protein [Tanacetum cinerariifolium]